MTLDEMRAWVHAEMAKSEDHVYPDFNSGRYEALDEVADKLNELTEAVEEPLRDLLARVAFATNGVACVGVVTGRDDWFANVHASGQTVAEIEAATALGAASDLVDVVRRHFESKRQKLTSSASAVDKSIARLEAQ